MPSKVLDLNGVLGKDVLVGGPDPFSWIDAKYKVTKKLLEKNYENPLEIHTRSDLISHDDYIANLNPVKHKVFMHICSTNDDFAKFVEPG
jgi:DNA repair photolyase